MIQEEKDERIKDLKQECRVLKQKQDAASTDIATQVWIAEQIRCHKNEIKMLQKQRP